MCLLEMQTSTAPEPASDSCAGSQEAQAGAPSTSGEGEYPRSQEGKGQLAVKPLHQGLRVRSPAFPPPSQNTNQVPVTQPKCLSPSLAPPPESQPNAGHCIISHHFRPARTGWHTSGHSARLLFLAAELG